ncbi:histidine kinase [Lactobacillus selangorensis]|uniref:histidine kinase n=1 Tax=Lactobacillus selangorensis TaxID=81857 RepID=A0A0R2FZC8_9LACO|nr:ATP-binding protein [Lactobacillus selangorensis]KRN27943.1 histidine kinase [Lactobacillus selangorensis]KRN30586.1 histidine kinase [Lactobacillus selangorensis]
MDQAHNRKLQWQFFWIEFVTFAILFVILGLLIFHFFQDGLFKDVDHNLKMQQEILVNPKKRTPPKKKRTPSKQNARQIMNQPFQAQMIIYGANGRILNKGTLGNRYSVLKKLHIPMSELNELTMHTVGNDKFRTLYIKVPQKSGDPQAAGHYVLLIENLNVQMAAITQFKQIMIVVLVLFWLLSIGISYLFSLYFIRPIMKASQKQQDFVADAAHELKTPLTIIQNKLETLLTKPHDQIIDQSEAIAQTLNESERLYQLTQDLLTLARSDAHTVELQPQSIELPQFLKGVCEPYREMAVGQQKKFRLQTNNLQTVTVDPKLLQQLLVILLDNSLKYTQAGEKIRVRTEAPQGPHWLLIVENTGRSISKEDQKHLFERFYRVDQARNENTGGTGLGLSIAKWIMEQHHGRITVKNVEPHGVSFQLIFPKKLK